MSDINSTALPDHDDGDFDDSGNRDGGKDSGARDYEVGYGKPPKATRFQKGKSGNPRGSKKGSRGLKKDLHKALSARHSIKVDGKVIKGTTQEMALFTLAKRAGTGDVRATRELVDLTLKIFGAEDRGRERAALSPQDQELLDRMLERIGPDEGAEAAEDHNAVRDAADDDDGNPNADRSDDTGREGETTYDKA